MHNPFTDGAATVIDSDDDLVAGAVQVTMSTTSYFTFRGITDVDGTATLFGDTLTAQR